MYFDFEDYRPDTPRVETAISTREGVLLSILIHAAVILYLLFGPPLPLGGNRAQIAQQLVLRQQTRRDSPRFVFVQPRVDIEAPKPPPRAEDSDKDRVARSPERAPDPKNALPLARGNSPERVEANPAPPVVRAEPPAEAGGDRSGRSQEADRQANSSPGSVLTIPNARATAPALQAGRSIAPGALGDALRNLQRYVERESFDNPQGGGPFGPEIQFDTKGVEFGPWIRRFVAQVKRNWLVPYAVMAFKGHVVITFNVHKSGSITELEIQAPSSVEAFNHAAYNALTASNPTQPLPPEYPSDRAFFTVTFFYNETPPSP